jgi:very-short-patch-repair endonuclease
MKHAEYEIKLKAKCKETGYRIKPKETYINAHTKILHKCYTCGNTWLVKPSNLLNTGSNCPSCSGPKSKPKNFEVYFNRIPDSVKAKFLFLDPLTEPAPKKVLVECRKCGSKFKTNRFNLIKGSNCAVCTNNIKKTTTSFIQQAKNKFDCSKIDFSKVDYKDAFTKIVLICLDHGEFMVKPTTYLHGNKYACPECALSVTSKSAKLTKDQVVARAEKLHKDKYTYDKLEYVDSHTRVIVTCRKHGDFTVLPYNLLQKQTRSGCPRCSKSISKPHEKLCEYLKSRGIRFETNARIPLDGKEIDIWIPKHKVGIEINGIYWHSAEKKDKNYHKQKSELAASKGITLLHFWDSEIVENFSLVTSIIRHKLGKSKSSYARQYFVEETTDKKSVNSFIDNSHLQGSCSYSVAFVLKKNDEIYAAMTFRKPRFDRNFNWEIIRFCIKPNHSIAGAASKLLSHFRRKYKGSIVSYANNLYSEGNVYKQIGMRYVRTSSPNYVWIKSGLQLSRYQTQKKKLGKILLNFNTDLSEDENMERAGFTKVYDAGHHVFVLD